LWRGLQGGESPVAPERELSQSVRGRIGTGLHPDLDELSATELWVRVRNQEIALQNRSEEGFAEHRLGSAKGTETYMCEHCNESFLTSENKRDHKREQCSKRPGAADAAGIVVVCACGLRKIGASAHRNMRAHQKTCAEHKRT